VAFVGEVREINKEEGMNPELAMETAIENCIKKGILTNFLNLHKEEVIKMLVKERIAAAAPQASVRPIKIYMRRPPT